MPVTVLRLSTWKTRMLVYIALRIRNVIGAGVFILHITKCVIYVYPNDLLEDLLQYHDWFLGKLQYRYVRVASHLRTIPSYSNKSEASMYSIT